MSDHRAITGLIQVYTGTGKGKTTAALGLSLRACGKGLSVFIIQFMKGRINYGELKSIDRLPGATIEQYGRPDFVDRKEPAQIDIDLARKGLERAKNIIASGDHDIVVLDELNVALDYKLIPEEEVIEMLEKRPDNVEVVITGRDAPRSMIDIADLVSVISEVKHPYRCGLHSREGIDL